MKRKYISIFLVCILVIGYTLIPSPQFNKPYSQVIYDREGVLLGGKIAKDGQWRFPVIDSVPRNYEEAILCYEDKRFHKHIGIDFISLLRAIKQNIRAQKVVSGASTLTMQVCRMAQEENSRNLPQKLLEMMMAIKYELNHSKKDILIAHTSHAPFGGNVVGLEAASWRYYSKSPYKLSTAEAALLAVLPNAPALMHPGKNRAKLKTKRNALLHKMLHTGRIDSTEYELSLMESIPQKPKPLPRLASHLLEYVYKKRKQHNQYQNSNNNKDNKVTHNKTTTTINKNLQETVNKTAKIFTAQNQQSDIQNMGIIVLDTKSGEVLAYLGNSPNALSEKAVDMVQAKRSSGSVLKPFLYAASLDDGIITPTGLLRDVPVQYNGYTPHNYNKTFTGAVKANEALAKSLNVPAVNLLKKYNISRFINQLKSLGLSSINKTADHYGLSLILGGAEVNLWELTGAYASMGRVLDRYKYDQSRYVNTDIHGPYYTPKPKPLPTKSNLQPHYSYTPTHLSAAAIHHTFTAMQKLSRPNAEGSWETFHSTRNIAWKTGTSYGHRDAWAVGSSPEYSIGVWVGNADGEGRHGLVGVQMAAPVLFDIFNQLEKITDLPVPYDDLLATPVCRTTGYIATSHCNEVDSLYQIKSHHNNNCPYHIKLNLDKEGYIVNGLCTAPSEMQAKSWLVLPPEMAHYYKNDHPEYQALPDTRPDCLVETSDKMISFIYPEKATKIYLPIDGDGVKEEAIFSVAHQNPKAKLFWHLDDTYLGYTEGAHSMAIDALPGQHQVVLIDGDGHSVKQNFEIVGL